MYEMLAVYLKEQATNDCQPKERKTRKSSKKPTQNISGTLNHMKLWLNMPYANSELRVMLHCWSEMCWCTVQQIH